MEDRRQRFEAQALPHLDAAYNLARWLTRSHADADDVVQEAVLRAFRNFDALRGGDTKPWLLAIVRNCYLTMASRRRGQKFTSLDEHEETNPISLAAPEKDPEARAIEVDESLKLNALIATLPDEYREALVLREMEDMSYREIAVVTGVPIGTVMSRLARARATLKERWLCRVGGSPS